MTSSCQQHLLLTEEFKRDLYYRVFILSVRLYYGQQAKFMLFFQSRWHIDQTVLPKCLVAGRQSLWLQFVNSRLVTHTYCSYHSNHTSISWISIGKKQRSGAWELSEGFSARTTCTNWVTGKKRYGNPAVSMATAVLTQLLTPHLSKYTAIRKWHFLLCAGRIVKYTESVANSLLLPPYSGAFHLSPSDFSEEMWIGSPCSTTFLFLFFYWMHFREVNCEMSFDARSRYHI